MAGFLIWLAVELILGVAIGLWILWRPRRVRALPPVRPQASLPLEWERQCEAHAKALEGSTMISPPGLRVDSGARERITAASFRAWGSAPNVEASADTAAHMWDDEDGFYERDEP